MSQLIIDHALACRADGAVHADGLVLFAGVSTKWTDLPLLLVLHFLAGAAEFLNGHKGRVALELGVDLAKDAILRSDVVERNVLILGLGRRWR